MSESIYFFDDQQQLLKIVAESNLSEVSQEKELTTDKAELLNSTLTVTSEYDEAIEEAAYMAIKEADQSFSMYRILTISGPENKLTFTGIDFAPDELAGYVVKDFRPKNETMEATAKRLVLETDWRIGHVDSGLKKITGTFYYISVKEALKQLQEAGCELLFKCSVQGAKISDKWIEIYRQIGTESTVRYTYGEKALTVVKELDRSQIYTSIIGRGKGEDVGDGYGRRLEFTNVEWKKANGNFLDKPKGQNWLEMPEMTKLYGIPTKNGSMRKREKVVSFEDEEDPKVLLEKTYAALVDCSRPLVQFKATVTDGDAIGNLVTIHRYDRGYHYQTRIFKTTIDRLTGIVEANIGDKLTTSLARKSANATNEIRTLNDEKMDFYNSEEVAKWQSDIIRGAKGGSVLMMSPADLGISDSRQPYQMVWMNGESIESSNHFLVANSDGIGFIDGKFDMSKFKTAWTIDGKFNADYIQSGMIKAGIFESSFNKTGDTLRLVKGLLQIWNDSVKIMELTKSGMQFWKGNQSLGTIGTTGGRFGGVAWTEEEKDRFVRISLDEGGRAILLTTKDMHSSTEGSYGIAIGNDGKIFIQGSGVSIMGENVDIYGKKLNLSGGVTINGQAPGTGGGGETPPELTTDQEKNAWAVWEFFKAKGWTEQAIAGLLGNMQGESGIMPDVDEVGGAGYGLVQWTSDILGETGSAYVQRLLREAGIAGDYRNINTQLQLLDWHMRNGQYIATAAYPYSVAEFIQLTDIATATKAFQANFERPRDDHPERVGWANYWYDKLKSVSPGTNNTWKNPVRSTYITTQEWDEPDYLSNGAAGIHGGLDIASMPAGTKPPVYAARTGTVETVTFDGTGGNYVVVKHSDNYWTYYGHLDSVNVSVGQTVSQETIIGIMGATGGATGVHLHFEVWKGGQWQRMNPRDVINF